MNVQRNSKLKQLLEVRSKTIELQKECNHLSTCAPSGLGIFALNAQDSLHSLEEALRPLIGDAAIREQA